ncbi:MAG: type IV secretory system conjugative DNA transfer family protein [Clostridia bacterium]|nr:type IV secretory system conjugative DNA transfer family protein [Clostridia bacterium]
MFLRMWSLYAVILYWKNLYWKIQHYNPFSYIHSEKDILKLVTVLIANTKGEGKAGEDFWVKAETLLYISLIGYIHYELPPEKQNFSTLIDILAIISSYTINKHSNTIT